MLTLIRIFLKDFKYLFCGTVKPISMMATLLATEFQVCDMMQM